jgi:hypothetical protein
MLTQLADRIPPLSTLLPVLLTAWAIAGTLLHGPAILAYVALQASTAGIFALSMYKVSRRHTREFDKPAGKPTASGDAESPQNTKRPVTAK